MPAKKQIDRQKIIDAACDIVRSEGFDGLNVRALAKKLNCSTQPIYLSFASIDEVKGEVMNVAQSTFERFVNEEIASGKYQPFKAVGMAYIRFGKEEKEFYKAIYLNANGWDKSWAMGEFNKSAGVAQKNYGFSDSNAKKIQTIMWVFVHGIATNCATGFLDWDWKDIDSLLTEVGAAFLKN